MNGFSEKMWRLVKTHDECKTHWSTHRQTGFVFLFLFIDSSNRCLFFTLDFGSYEMKTSSVKQTVIPRFIICSSFCHTARMFWYVKWERRLNDKEKKCVKASWPLKCFSFLEPIPPKNMMIHLTHFTIRLIYGRHRTYTQLPTRQFQDTCLDRFLRS